MEALMFHVLAPYFRHREGQRAQVKSYPGLVFEVSGRHTHGHAVVLI